MMFRRSLKSFAPLTFVFALALGGCASAGPLSEGDEDVASASEAASEATHARGHAGKFGHPHGHELFVAALHELDLTAEQRKTIEGALETLSDTHEADRKGFQKALADGVRAGTIDEAAVKATLGDVDKQAGEHRAAFVKALGTLHATLTPAQRGALVAHVEERMAKHGREGERGPRGPEGAKHGPRGEHGPMGFLLRGIEVRDEQRAQIASALEASRPERHEKMDRAAWAKKHEEKRARRKAGFEAFRGDKFDAEALLPEKDARPPFGDHLVKALSAVVPVLDADQRVELAKRIEQGPRGPFFGGKHGPGHHGETQAPPSR